MTAARYRGSMIESLLRLSTLRKFSFDKLISQSKYAQKRGYLVSLAMTILLEIDTEAPGRWIFACVEYYFENINFYKF